MRCLKPVRIVVFHVRLAMVLKISIAYHAKIIKRSIMVVVWILVRLGFLPILMLTVNHVISNVLLVKGLKTFV
jgi:hypothetical protein